MTRCGRELSVEWDLIFFDSVLMVQMQIVIVITIFFLFALSLSLYIYIYKYHCNHDCDPGYDSV